jgi:hypothetical protein
VQYPERTLLRCISDKPKTVPTPKMHAHSSTINVKPQLPSDLIPDEKIINEYRKATNRGRKLFRLKK